MAMSSPVHLFSPLRRAGKLCAFLLLVTPLLVSCGSSSTTSSIAEFVEKLENIPDDNTDRGTDTANPGNGNGVEPGAGAHSDNQQDLALKTSDDPDAVVAARFLTQATFGPTQAEINDLVESQLNFENWVNRQIALPVTFHSPANMVVKNSPDQIRVNDWWKTVINSEDQLRQRMAWALSQIFVVGDQNDVLQSFNHATYGYYDFLVADGLGDFERLLNKVSNSLTMGIYLTLEGSKKADDTGVRPDENYAREVLQLFSIGLFELNTDGTQKLDANGRPIPTYNQDDIVALARAITGWQAETAPNIGKDGYSLVFEKPMKAVENTHDTGEKTLLGATIQAGQTTAEDMASAMGIIFNHPNVGPFISKQLIQRLVTSNPRKSYVARVATVFNDDGTGKRGNLAAVAKAILLDEEARNGHAAINSQLAHYFGKVREPLLKASHVWRAFNANPMSYDFKDPEKDFLQGPMRSPTVFNFYFPDFTPNETFAKAGLVAPEIQITTDSSITSAANKLFAITQGRYNASAEIDVSVPVGLIAEPDKLISYLDLILTSGAMPDGMRQILLTQLSTSTASDDEKVRDLIYLIVTSAEYAVQR